MYLKISTCCLDSLMLCVSIPSVMNNLGWVWVGWFPDTPVEKQISKGMTVTQQIEWLSCNRRGYRFNCNFLLLDVDVPLGKALNSKLPTKLCLGVWMCAPLRIRLGLCFSSVKPFEWSVVLEKHCINSINLPKSYTEVQWTRFLKKWNCLLNRLIWMATGNKVNNLC